MSREQSGTRRFPAAASSPLVHVARNPDAQPRVPRRARRTDRGPSQVVPEQIREPRSRRGRRPPLAAGTMRPSQLPCKPAAYARQNELTAALRGEYRWPRTHRRAPRTLGVGFAPANDPAGLGRTNLGQHPQTGRRQRHDVQAKTIFLEIVRSRAALAASRSRRRFDVRRAAGRARLCPPDRHALLRNAAPGKGNGRQFAWQNRPRCPRTSGHSGAAAGYPARRKRLLSG